ncbi:MAG: hypothetical protein AAFV07_14275, partial [Bacteroidota bacterium]
MHTFLYPESLLKPLGYAILPDSHKGNYREALNVLDDPAAGIELAERKLLRAVIHLFQGEVKTGLEGLASLRAELDADHPLQLRIRVYQWYGQVRMYNLFPDNNGANGMEISGRWNEINSLKASQDEVSALTHYPQDPSIQLEKKIFHAFLHSLQNNRSSIQDAHSVNPASRQDMLLGTAFGSLDDCIADFKRLDAPPLTIAYGLLAGADLGHRAGNTRQREKFLLQAEAIYQECEDLTGQGMCMLSRGDWLATQISSPLVLDYSIADVHAQNNDQDWRLEEKEFADKAPMVDWEQVMSFYDKAEVLFRESDSPRAMGQLWIRRGYLAWIQENIKAAGQYFEQALKQFEAAGDILHLQLAQTLKALSSLLQGQLTDSLEIAADIGEWGKNTGSFSYALGLGILVGRAAKEQVVRKHAYEKAIFCYQMAQALFDALGAEVNAAQCQVAIGQTHESLGQHDTALIQYELASDMLLGAYDRRFSQEMELRERIILLSQTHYRLALNVMDGEAISRLLERLDHLPSAPVGDNSHPIEALIQVQRYSLLAALLGSMRQDASVYAPLYKGVKYQIAGNRSQARQYFREAEEVADSIPNDYFIKAVVRSQQKKYQEAKYWFDQHLQSGHQAHPLISPLAQILMQ